MNKLLLLSLLASFYLIGCAADESNNPDWKAGIYTGSITPYGAASEPSFLLITSDKRAFFAETDVENAGLGTVSGSVVSFGDQASMTQTDEFTGTFDFGFSSGTFSLSETSLYNTAPSADTLQGTYVDNYDYAEIGVTTWHFTDGAFTFEGGDFSCSGAGNMVPIDITKNEYEVVEMSISGCINYPDEIYTGLAFIDTNATKDTIYLLAQNATFDALIFIKMTR